MDVFDEVNFIRKEKKINDTKRNELILTKQQYDHSSFLTISVFSSLLALLLGEPKATRSSL